MDKGGKHVNYVSESITHLIADNPAHPKVIDGEIYEKISVTVSYVGDLRKIVVVQIEPIQNLN